ncbi:MAG: hypothetical protein M3014_00605 [Chloroflexota bacterium]|nr:hypothetical protein [Chloroflexota bacterium]
MGRTLRPDCTVMQREATKTRMQMSPAAPSPANGAVPGSRPGDRIDQQ